MLIDYFKCEIKKINFPVSRMGLSATYRPGIKTIHKALDEGINLYFCFGFDSQMIKVLRDLPENLKEKIVIVTGAYNFKFFHQNIIKVCEKRLKQLNVECIDAFLFLGVLSEKELTPKVIESLNKLKEDGKIKLSGISTHNRKLAGDIVENNLLDLLMIRYNAAHRGAEKDIFEKLKNKRPTIIAYTATNWTRLIRPSKRWHYNRVPSAGDCYRFVLNNPDVDVCLMAPKNLKEFKENMDQIKKGKLDDKEINFIKEYGDFIYQQKKWFM